MTGKIILLNGASSAGKSTLARGLQAALSEPFWHYSIDHLLAANILPHERMAKGDFTWHALRPAFFDGFHRSIPALAQAGNNLIVEHIVETREWMDRLLTLLMPLDVFFIGIHCPLDALEQRELVRGDRPLGDARMDFRTVHTFGVYDFEVDSTQALSQNVSAVIAAWQTRQHPSAFEKMSYHRAIFSPTETA